MATLKRLSDVLSSDSIYTREDLKEIIPTNDQTLYTGIFQPPGYDTVLIFVTENKTADRTQFEDYWDGRELHWQGQMAGRKDALIIEHVDRGLELLVFYRKKKDEFARGGFRYLGPFNYVRHWGSQPASFILRPSKKELEVDQLADREPSSTFDATSVEDGRERVQMEIVRRRGQPAFRRALMATYGGQCAITGCDAEDALEAAHIHPYMGDATNHVSNGLLLRADVHTLFDLGLISVDSATMSVRLSPRLKGTAFAQFQGKPVRIPEKQEDRPSKSALDWHFGNCFK